MIIGTISIFFVLFVFFVVNAQSAHKPTKNYTKLCKTKPISEKAKFTQTLSQKQLTKIFALFGNQKTKPKQSQTKPISKTAKTNATCLSQRDYEKILAFFRQKNKAKTNPISRSFTHTKAACFGLYNPAWT